MTIQPGAAVYTQGFGSRPENVEVPTFQPRAPSPKDMQWPLGKRWIDTLDNAEYVLTSFSSSLGAVSANWALLGVAAGALNTLSDDSSVAVTPSAGNIQLAGTAGQIATTAGSSEITFSLIGPYTPATYTAHGVLLGEGSSSIVATTPGTNGQVLIGSTGADPAFSTITSSGGTLTLTGGANTLNIDLAAPVTVPNGGTGLTSVTAHDLLVGNGTSALTLLAPSATSGVALISQGAASNPAYGTVVVAGGGTGATTLTAHGVLLGEGTGAVVATTAGATDSVLQGSTGADPSFTTTPTVATLTTTGLLTGGTGVTATTGNIVATAGAVNAGTSMTATLGAITATNGNLVLGTAGNKILSTSVATTTTAGDNSFGSVTLSSGTATVATTAVTDNSLIVVWRQAVGASTALGEISVGTISAATSFVVYAATVGTPGTPLATDASVVGWMIIN